MQYSICVFDASTGNQLWKSDFTMDPDVHPNTPVYIDGYLFCTSGYGLGSKMLQLAADGNSVSEVWKDATCDPKIGGVVVLNGRIYGTGDRNRKFFCLDWKTGKELFSIRDLAPANIIANDGLLYVYSESGKINLVEPKSDGFNVISSFPVPFGANPHWAHLVIKDKKLYVRHGISLMVYDIAANYSLAASFFISCTHPLGLIAIMSYQEPPLAPIYNWCLEKQYFFIQELYLLLNWRPFRIFPENY